MKSYLKFLSRNKLYTAIEAVGLAVSLAFVIIIGISVIDQLRIRRDTPSGINLYSIGPNSYGTEYRNLVSLSSIPEIKSLAAFTRVEFLADMNGEKDMVMTMIADPGILDYVPQQVIHGDIRPFQNGSGVLITESAARKLFPGKDPIGESVTIANIGIKGEEETPVSEQIVAVIGNPGYSILDDFDLMLSFRSKIPAVVEIVESDLFNTGNGQFVNVLADMQQGFDMEEFSSKYMDLFDPYVNRGDKEKPMATAFSDIFFSSDSYEGLRQGNRLYIIVLVILGLILLISALLNYINLNLAVSGERAKEMATRQLVGASRKSVIFKGVSESTLFTLICYAFAVLLAEWMVPLLNGLRPNDFTIPFHLPFNGTFILISLTLVVVIGFLSGLIPALVMASYRPLDVVTGQVRRKRKMGANQVFIGFQTVLSLLCIVASLSVEAQLRFMLKQDVGINPVKNLYHFWPGMYEPITEFGNALSAHPQVKAMGYGTGYPTKSWGVQAGPNGAVYSTVECDSSAFRMLGFRVKEQWGESIPGTFWLTEEARNYIGVTEEDSHPSRLWGAYPNPRITSIGGVVENYRSRPVNESNPFIGNDFQELGAVCIEPEEQLSGIWIEAGGDRSEFDRWFKGYVRHYYHETKGLSDILAFPGVLCGYLDDIISREYDDLKRYVHIIEIFTLIAVLLSVLGLIAMSTWFAASNSKDVAVRKVFGSTVALEVKRLSMRFLAVTVAAVAVGIPLSVWMVGRFLERYPERISGYWWIFAVAAFITIVIAIGSVLWQTLKAARTNPAIELKKE